MAVSMLAVSSVVSAQEKSNKDAEGRTVRGPYETNSFGSNWFIGVAGGINTVGTFKLPSNMSNKAGVGGAVELTVGKWVTPCVGLRLGYQGIGLNGKLTTSGVTENYKKPYHYAHADVLWNVSNAIGGYRDDRFWNFSPYITTGYVYSQASNYVLGIGLLNSLRLCDRLDLTIDLRGVTGKASVIGLNKGRVCNFSALVGLSVDLGKNKWKRATQIPEGYAPYSTAMVDELKSKNAQYAKENDQLGKEVASLKKENGSLKSENDALKKAAKAPKKLTVTSGAVFFKIGETTLSSADLYQLDFYVKNVIEQDPDAKFLLTGYADKNTGGKKRNQYLSEKRVEYVSNILRTKYNVDENRIVVKAVGSEAAFSDKVELNRCVVLEYAD
ncbi:MAG: OmpA family protein [Candidatus Cryptobacteroides sp.]